MMRTMAVFMCLAALCSAATAGSRLRHRGDRSVKLVPDVEEVGAVSPVVAGGLTFIYAVVVVLAFLATLAVIENRRMISPDSWMANTRALSLYRGLAVLSILQGGLGLYKILMGDHFSGLFDVFNAAIGNYATRPAGLYILPKYMAFTACTSIVDLFTLSQDANILTQWGDIARPVLCITGIFFAWEFIKEYRASSSSYAGDGLLPEPSKGGVVKMGEFLDAALKFPVVQEALNVLGVIDGAAMTTSNFADPLTQPSGASACKPMLNFEANESQCTVLDCGDSEARDILGLANDHEDAAPVLLLPEKPNGLAMDELPEFASDECSTLL